VQSGSKQNPIFRQEATGFDMEACENSELARKLRNRMNVYIDLALNLWQHIFMLKN